MDSERVHFQSVLRAGPLTRKYIKLPVWSVVASSNVAVKNAFCHSSPAHYVVTRQSCYITWCDWYQMACERFDPFPFQYKDPELWAAGLWRVFSFSLNRGNKETLSLKVLPYELCFEIALMVSLQLLAKKYLHLWNMHIFTGCLFPLSHLEQIFIRAYKIGFEKLKHVILYGSWHHMARCILHCQWPTGLTQFLLCAESSRREGGGGHWEGTRRGRPQQGRRRLKCGGHSLSHDVFLKLLLFWTPWIQCVERIASFRKYTEELFHPP